MKRNPRAHYDGDGKWVIIFDHPRLSDYMWTGSGLKPGIKMWSGLRAKEFSSEAEANAEIRDIVLDHIIKYKDDFGQYIRGWPRTNPLMAKRGKTAYYGERKMRDALTGPSGEPLADENFLFYGPFGNVGRMFGHHPDTYVGFALIDPNDIDALSNALNEKPALFHMHRAGFMGEGTIPMFWKQNKHVAKYIAAACQFAVPEDDDRIVVTHISVKPAWKHSGLASSMLASLMEQFPGKRLVAHEATDEGRGLFEAFSKTRGVPVEFIDRWPDSPRRNPLPVAAAMAIGAVAGAGAGYYYGKNTAKPDPQAAAVARHLAKMLAFDMGYEKVADLLGVRPRDFSQVVTGSPSGDIRIAWDGMTNKNSLSLIVDDSIVESFPVEVQSRAGANSAIRAMWEKIRKSPGWQQ